MENKKINNIQSELTGLIKKVNKIRKDNKINQSHYDRVQDELAENYSLDMFDSQEDYERFLDDRLEEMTDNYSVENLDIDLDMDEYGYPRNKIIKKSINGTVSYEDLKEKKLKSIKEKYNFNKNFNMLIAKKDEKSQKLMDFMQDAMSSFEKNYKNIFINRLDQYLFQNPSKVSGKSLIVKGVKADILTEKNPQINFAKILLVGEFNKQIHNVVYALLSKLDINVYMDSLLLSEDQLVFCETNELKTYAINLDNWESHKDTIIKFLEKTVFDLNGLDDAVNSLKTELNFSNFYYIDKNIPEYEKKLSALKVKDIDDKEYNMYFGALTNKVKVFDLSFNDFIYDRDEKTQFVHGFLGDNLKFANNFFDNLTHQSINNNSNILIEKIKEKKDKDLMLFFQDTFAYAMGVSGYLEAISEYPDVLEDKMLSFNKSFLMEESIKSLIVYVLLLDISNDLDHLDTTTLSRFKDKGNQSLQILAEKLVEEKNKIKSLSLDLNAENNEVYETLKTKYANGIKLISSMMDEKMKNKLNSYKEVYSLFNFGLGDKSKQLNELSFKIDYSTFTTIFTSLGERAEIKIRHSGDYRNSLISMKEDSSYLYIRVTSEEKFNKKMTPDKFIKDLYAFCKELNIPEILTPPKMEMFIRQLLLENKMMNQQEEKALDNNQQENRKPSRQKI